MPLLNQALRGIRVLDFSQGIAGPYAGSLLAEMGAEVVKIEPAAGDWLRTLGYKANGSSILFGTYNKGKRGLSIDLKHAAALPILREIVKRTDIVIENSRPGVMKRLGLDFDALKLLNPRLIYLSVSGFGQKGPSSNQPATDAAMQAFSGFSFGAGDMKNPVRVRISMIDIVSGLYASQALLASLVQRGVSGQGQYIDISLMHCISAVQAYKFAEHEATGGAIAGELFAAIGIYRTSDGFVAISAMRDQQVIDLVNMIGKGALLCDPLLDSPMLRFQNQDRLRQEIAKVLETQTSEHWLEKMKELDLICQKVQDYGMFRSHPQVLDQQIFSLTDLGEVGNFPAVRTPGMPIDAVNSPAPAIGSDSRDILRDWGVGEEAINELIEHGVVKQNG